MDKIFIYADGCKRRLLDAKRVFDYLTKNDYRVVDKIEEADIIILFACAASNEATWHALNRVKELLKYDAELIVAGCLPAIEKEELAKIFSGKTISTKDLENISIIFPEKKISFNKIDDANIYVMDLTLNSSIRNLKKLLRKLQLVEKLYVKTKDYVIERLFKEHSIFRQLSSKNQPYCIRISWGCLGNCSYCVIKKGIGSHKSKPLDVCVREFRKGLDGGYKYFILTSDDTGAYGSDIGSSFPELLDELTKIDGDYEISIRAVSPHWVVKYVDELVEITKRRKISIFDIDIQSGDGRILRLMNRYSDTEKMKDAIIKLRKAYPDIALSTHIIVGFPSETEEEFMKSLRFVIEVGYRSGAIFPFSCIKSTKAAKMEAKLPKEEISKRIKYAKKYLKKEGYIVRNRTKNHPILFDKKC